MARANRWRTEIGEGRGLTCQPGFSSVTVHSRHELPELLNAAASEELIIPWVYLSACMYKLTPIGAYPAAHSELFTYLRYNAELSLEGLTALGVGHLRPEDVQPMDSVDHIPEMQEVGRAAAKKVSIDHLNGFTT